MCKCPLVYVAGKWGDRKSIAGIMKQVTDLGASITHDWTVTEADLIPTPEQMARAAVYDTRGVQQADIVILLITDATYQYRGTCTELGIALGLRKQHIWIVGESTTEAARNVFWHHPTICHFHTLDEAMVVLATMCAQTP